MCTDLRGLILIAVQALTVPNPPPTARVPQPPDYDKPQFQTNSIDVTSFDVPGPIAQFFAIAHAPSAVSAIQLSDDVHALALALRAVPNAPPDMLRMAGQISNDANTIRRGPAELEIPALGDAVTLARRALTRFVVPDALQLHYQDELERIDDALSKLDARSSIAAQSRIIGGALDGVATALVLALGHDPAELERAASERVFVRGRDASQQVAALRQRLGRLASEEDLQARRETVGLLDDLADAIGNVGPARNPALDRLRQTIDLLKASDLKDVDLIRQALAQATDALGALDRGDAHWVHGAQAAAANVVRGKPFELQRAAIQDALRALVDAFAAMVEAP